MAENTKKIKKAPSPLIGAQAQPTTLDKTIKLDIDTNKEFIDNIIEAGVKGSLDTQALDAFTSISNNRDQIYQLIDTMANDSTVSAIVRTYAEDVCETADNGHIIWCESPDPNISKFINYLLNVINVDKHIFGWTYCLIKYGDVYLRLYRESDYKDPLFKKDSVEKAYSAKNVLNESFEPASKLDEAVKLNIHSANDPYSYYVEMVDDPGTMFELTKFGKTYGYIETPNQKEGMNYLSAFIGTNMGVGQQANFRMKSNDVNVYQADDFVHACLDDNFTRYPEKVDIFISDEDYKNNANAQSYSVRRGKSLLYDSYKIWREKSLLENAALLNRVTKSSLIRNVQVEVGNMPKPQVKQTLRSIKELFEQKTAVDTNKSMNEYPNPGPIENTIYTASHNGQGAITIAETGGDVDVKNLADLDWWNNKFYASYGIPKQYFGWTDDGAGFNGGTSLTILSSVYAKGVKRVQNSMIQAITDIINLILVSKGCRSYLNNFVLKMKTPLTQEEKDYREDLSSRVSAISNMQSLFADIEDRGRKLKILKNLIGTLNYGDEIMSEIQSEIEAAEKASAEEAEQAEANEAEGSGGEIPTENAEPVNLNLGSSAEVPMESFTGHGGDILVEGPDFVSSEDDHLPTPDEANENLDFSVNK